LIDWLIDCHCFSTGQFVALSFDSTISIGRARAYYVDVWTRVRPDTARAVGGDEDRLNASTPAFDVAAGVAVHRAAAVRRSPATLAEGAAGRRSSSARDRAAAERARRFTQRRVVDQQRHEQVEWRQFV